MKSKVPFLAYALSLAVCPLTRSQSNELKVGDSAPPLSFEVILQAPTGTQTSWPALRGKVVVLEFWATWCVPCIGAIPHLNELADAFKDSPVQFIAITDEQEKVVTPFLARRPIHAWIGLSTNKSAFRSYGVVGIPTTVVVDQTGKTAAITRPTELTGQHLRDLLAGKKLALPSPQRLDSFTFRPGELPGNANQAPSLFQLLIRPSESLNSGFGGSGGKFTFIGSSVMNMLCAAFSVNPLRVVTNSILPEGRFDAVINIPTKQENSGRNWLRQVVEETFDLRVRRESREMETLILTVTNPNADHLSPTVSTGGSSSRSDAASGTMQSMNMPISALAGSLEDLLKKPVLDETRLTNRYDWTLQWEVKNSENPSPDALLKAVREQLGLSLSVAKRPIEVIVVDKAD